MKIYLQVYENLCRRCGRRWTSSAIADRTGYLLAPSIQVQEVAGFFVKPQSHGACFNCLEPTAPNLPNYYVQLNSRTAEPTSPKAIPPKAATLDDILGD